MFKKELNMWNKRAQRNSNKMIIRKQSHQSMFAKYSTNTILNYARIHTCSWVCSKRKRENLTRLKFLKHTRRNSEHIECWASFGIFFFFCYFSLWPILYYTHFTEFMHVISICSIVCRTDLTILMVVTI